MTSFCPAYSLIDCGGNYVLAQPLTKTLGHRTWLGTLRRLLASCTFKTIGFAGLIVSLFMGPTVVLLDLPDHPWNHVVDVTMVSVMAFFAVEIVLRCLAEPTSYTLSFLFWMDVIGTLSMVFEISFLLGSAGKMSTSCAGDSYPVMRTTNAVRCFGRAGRLAMPLRCPSMLFVGLTGDRSDIGTNDTSNTAKFLGHRVATVLSTKVAMLTVILVLGVPIFGIGRYPEEDFSLRMSSKRLEAEYARSYLLVTNATASGRTGSHGSIFKTTLFEAAAKEVFEFYSDLEYFPYRLEGYDEEVVVNGEPAWIPGSPKPGREPRRRQSIIKQEVSRCIVARPHCEGSEKAAIYFDFTAVRQYSAGLDMVVICFLILCMGVESWEVGRNVTRMVVVPLEKMLRTAHCMADVLNQAIRQRKVSGEVERELEEEEEIGEDFDETALLERVFRKMARLTSVFVEQNVVDEAKLSSMDAESKGVIVEVMQYRRGEARRTSRRGNNLTHSSAVSVLPVSEEDVGSWGLNLLALDPDQCKQVVSYILFDSPIGKSTGRIWIEPHTFDLFAEIVKRGYQDNPYHSWTHGCDVVASCFRILLQVHWEDWLTDVDTVALLVSSLCHDIGHPGKTNPFLVETSNDLALRYNDKSPLENMHCARLFEICTDEKLNVFGKFDRASYKHARSVCIAGILYTDNAMHFDLVKEVRKVFETSVDLVDPEADFKKGVPKQYLQDVIIKNHMLWIKVILHLADVSNPLKTFTMNRLWAMRVVDEFFAQGDEEKRLGIPVGMLNDRDKVNRSGAEHGFINFLLAPLVVSVVRVFPMMHPLGTQMVNNMTEWLNTWMIEASPSDEDIKKREADVEKVREQVAELVSRKPRSSMVVGPQT